ncbi:site-specific DNA-methyltransferase [Modicisalibacter zincidurans]|uniref:site-specific DNA-methyltransferase (adenine-specific) n=1 Tax=Modicisalibacter zincidurans TaxID=1178777 RepID=A0ABP9R3Z2_9GAMM|nr:site-specific DNA-methyltransferase [Halomonas zincidurans]
MTAPIQAFDQLRRFLKDMFQFEAHDLDFGIYRITRLKRQFIQSFIDGEADNSLRSTVNHALGSVHNSQSETARHWLAAFAAQFGDMGRPLWQAVAENPDDENAQSRFRSLFTMPVLSDEQREQAEAQLTNFLETRQLSAEQLETKVYNHLLNFFELYYQNGDFGYNTRATSAFKVPYEADYDGSDTLFHWKHKDSYYIKTGNGFHSVRCQVAGQWLEFRLTHGDNEQSQTSERNNNKDADSKHYRLVDIQPIAEQGAEGDEKTVWQVRFALAVSSTPKIALYTRLWQTVFQGSDDLTPYLHKKPDKSDPEPGKPLFNDLTDDFDKSDGGQIKGIGQLRLKFERYLEELAKRSEFADLGGNAGERQQELEQDWIAGALWQIDRNLNKFYVGNDADYFIHKDLQGFLTREKSRFIKQVIFSDLDALLHAGEDNATTLIARTFNQVADTLIGFLAAIENFQKGLFELKKKVVDTHYLVSVGKLPAHFHARVFANVAQRDEWRDVFKVDVSTASELAEHPTLVVDTRLYRESDPTFQDDLLSLAEFDDLDEQTDGLLINSENWQALNLLQEKFREQIKCIYIDPPYNTGGDGFLYKDSFRHSSWASMMHDRLSVSRNFLSQNGVIFSSIDQNERNSLQEILATTLGGNNKIGEIVWHNATDNNPTRIAHEHEYIISYAKSLSNVESEWKSAISDAKKSLIEIANTLSEKHSDEKELKKEYAKWFKENKPFLGQMDRYKYIDHGGVYTGSQSVHNPGKEGYRYDFIHPDTGRPCKQPLMGYRFPETTMKRLMDEDRILFGEDENKIVELKVYAHEFEDKLSSIIKLDGRSGANDLRAMFPKGKKFSNPKPSALLESLLPFIVEGDDIVMDYFAGSGTTAQAVIALNRRDNERRRFVLAEMGDYFDSILKPRVTRTMHAGRWRDGVPISDVNWMGIIKVQRLEQYEDLLDNLALDDSGQPRTHWDEAALPQQIPVNYLFRPEQNSLSSSLDVSRPFSQTLRIGKAREEKPIDLMETWCYLQGYWVKSRRVYRPDTHPDLDRQYLAVETTHGTLVVFRDIDPAEDDTTNLHAILAHYADAQGVSRIQRLELNFDADLRRLELDTYLIQASDFLRGAQWS